MKSGFYLRPDGKEIVEIEDWGKEFERLLKNQSRDSLLWARCTSYALFSLYKVNIDETYLHTVFANAMMSMHDSIYNNEIKNLEKENAELKVKVEKLKECVEFYAVNHARQVLQVDIDRVKRLEEFLKRADREIGGFSYSDTVLQREIREFLK